MSKTYRRNMEERDIEQIKYMTKSLSDKCIKAEYQKVGVLTSVKNQGRKDEIIHSMEMFCDQIEFKNLCSIEKPAQMSEEMEECDAVILIERYSDTTYKRFEELLSLINKQKKEILGFITYR